MGSDTVADRFSWWMLLAGSVGKSGSNKENTRGSPSKGKKGPRAFSLFEPFILSSTIWIFFGINTLMGSVAGCVFCARCY